MANSAQILNKIARNLGQEGLAFTQGASSVSVGNVVITYVPASIQSPMGGVDGSVSPFLGIGVANPGKIQLKGTAGLNTIAAIFTSATELKALSLATAFANNVIVQAGDTTAQLAEIPGMVDLLAMGS